MRRDPYRVLEVSPNATSEELHDAYRRMVKLHHPDRNGGSEESARRFEEIQEAYEDVRSRRPRPARTNRAAEAAESVKDRMAGLERELREAQAARERARRAAREAPPTLTANRLRRPATTASGRSSVTSASSSPTASRRDASTPRCSGSAS